MAIAADIAKFAKGAISDSRIGRRIFLRPAEADHGAYFLRHAVHQSDKNNGESYSDQFANISEDAAGGKDGESKI